MKVMWWCDCHVTMYPSCNFDMSMYLYCNHHVILLHVTWLSWDHVVCHVPMLHVTWLVMWQWFSVLHLACNYDVPMYLYCNHHVIAAILSTHMQLVLKFHTKKKKKNCILVLKNQKGGSGRSAGVEVYTAPGMQFWLAFWCALIRNANHTRAVFTFCFVLECYEH